MPARRAERILLESHTDSRIVTAISISRFGCTGHRARQCGFFAVAERFRPGKGAKLVS